MTRAEKYLGYSDWPIAAIGLPLITVIVTFSAFVPEDRSYDVWQCIFISFMYTVCYWTLMRNFLIRYHQKFNSYDFTWKRIVYVFSYLFVIYFVVKLLLGFTLSYFFPEVMMHNKDNYIIQNIIPAIIIFAMFFLYEGLFYLNKSRLIEIEKNKLERITAQQKLDTLKNQVNPHFLFNSLNTLVTMIPEDSQLAVNFVQKLSSTYRNILEYRDEKLITINLEMDALDSYIYLLKTRFQGKIHIYNKVPDDVKKHFVLPLSLQILIENAVKHNITSTNKPLKIDIFTESDFLVVRNNFQPKNQVNNSTKMGLENIRSRYELLANKEIVVENDGKYFTVHLPLIKNNS